MLSHWTGASAAASAIMVAEGVETEPQRIELERLGCDYAQGYLFSKPVESAAALALVQADTGSPKSIAG